MPQIKRICYDKILPRDLRRAIRFERFGPAGRTRAISPIGKLWPNGTSLHIAFLGGNADQHQAVKRFAPKWTRFANLTFDFDGSANADIRIAFEDDGAWSYIGTDAKGIAHDEPTMNFGWLDEAVVLHEFGHAIGLAHEHQNPEGGIRWNEAAVIRDLSGPPNYWDEATIRHNVLNKYTHDQINGTEFDPKSIMLYSFPAEWTRNGFQSEPNENLSPTDESFVSSNRMYPGGQTPPDETELPLTEIQTTPASIGQPGEEDLFRFKVGTAGKVTVETVGETDLVMKLFGPDSRTTLIGEDDDSGEDYNPRIMAHLRSGTYYVQVRHYNRVGGRGSYGIRVYR